MNLEQMIDEVYGNYQAELKAKEDARKLHEQQEIEQAIALFRSDFDATISLELQKDLGIEIRTVYQKPVYVCAEFVYRGEDLIIDRWGGDTDWRLLKVANQYHLCGGKFNIFLNLLLIELGKIRTSSIEPEPESMTIEEAADTLAYCICSVNVPSKG